MVYMKITWYEWKALLDISCVFYLKSLNFFRLIAQIHDELLFEVEDSQIQEFSGKYNLFLSPSPFPNNLSFFLIA